MTNTLIIVARSGGRLPGRKGRSVTDEAATLADGRTVPDSRTAHDSDDPPALSQVAGSAAEAATPAGPARITFFNEFARVLRTRPDWLYGMLCSWLLGFGTFAFLVVFTHPDLTKPLNAVIVPVVLTAVADGSLTNQLAAEPQWVSGLLRSGTDPGRILLARNILLALWELLFVAMVVGLTVWLGHSGAWVRSALPQLAVLPLASIAVGNLASVLVPCPFMRMSKRFQATGTWARWTIYIAVPFALSSVAAAMWALPTYLEGRWEPRTVAHAPRTVAQSITAHPITSLTSHPIAAHPIAAHPIAAHPVTAHVLTIPHASRSYVMIWVIVIPLWNLTVWLASLKLAQALARVRRHRLVRLMDKHGELTARLPDLSLRAAARQLPARIREIPADLRGELSMLGSELREAGGTITRL